MSFRSLVCWYLTLQRVKSPKGALREATFIFCHLTLWHSPPPWRIFRQVEVIGGGVFLLANCHVLKEELLLHCFLAPKVRDKLSRQELPPGKESLPASWPSGRGHINLPQKRQKKERTYQGSTCFLSCGSMEPSFPHSSSPPLVATSFKPSLNNEHETFFHSNKSCEVKFSYLRLKLTSSKSDYLYLISSCSTYISKVAKPTSFRHQLDHFRVEDLFTGPLALQTGPHVRVKK